MKKITAFMLSVLCAFCMAGCGSDSDVQEEKQTLDLNETEASSETSADDASETQKNTVQAETDAQGSTSSVPVGETLPVQSGNINETIYQGEYQEEGTPVPVPSQGGNSAEQGGAPAHQVTVPSLPKDGTEPAEGVHGAQGMTESEWLAAAQEIYREGCDTAFRFLCTGSEFPFDMKNLDILDKTYFLTTCSSFDDATAGYYEIFSREMHKNDFDGLLTQHNGRIYAARAARGMDMTYLSSQVEKIVSVSEKEVVFTVSVEYEDSVTETEFSLVPEDGVWKIGKFTLPY